MGTSSAYFEHYRYGRKQPLQLAEAAPSKATRSRWYWAPKWPARWATGSTTASCWPMALPGQPGAARRQAVPRGWRAAAHRHSCRPHPAHQPGRHGSAAHRLAERHAARGAARIDAEQARGLDLQPQQITAFLLGLNSKVATFTLQREINQYRGEPLLAILPGVALQELWSLMGTAEKALFVVSLFVVLTGLIGMLTAILTSLNERRRRWRSCARWVLAPAYRRAVDHRGLRSGAGGHAAGAGPVVCRDRHRTGAAAEPVRPVSAVGPAERL